jgi:hypothetical protein
MMSIEDLRRMAASFSGAIEAARRGESLTSRLGPPSALEAVLEMLVTAYSLPVKPTVAQRKMIVAAVRQSKQRTVASSEGGYHHDERR